MQHITVITPIIFHLSLNPADKLCSVTTICLHCWQRWQASVMLSKLLLRSLTLLAFLGILPVLLATKHKRSQQTSLQEIPNPLKMPLVMIKWHQNRCIIGNWWHESTSANEGTNFFANWKHLCRSCVLSEKSDWVYREILWWSESYLWQVFCVPVWTFYVEEQPFESGIEMFHTLPSAQNWNGILVFHFLLKAITWILPWSYASGPSIICTLYFGRTTHKNVKFVGPN